MEEILKIKAVRNNFSYKDNEEDLKQRAFKEKSIVGEVKSRKIKALKIKLSSKVGSEDKLWINNQF